MFFSFAPNSLRPSRGGSSMSLAMGGLGMRRSVLALQLRSSSSTCSPRSSPPSLSFSSSASLASRSRIASKRVSSVNRNFARCFARSLTTLSRPSGLGRLAHPSYTSTRKSKAWLVRNMSSLPEHQVLKMPALSPTMKTGNIASYKIKVGDKVAPGDLLCEIETDKATIGWESQDEGYIAAILMPEGSQDVPVGKEAIVLVENAADVPAFANYKPGEDSAGKSEPAPAAPQPKQSAPAANSKSYPPHQLLNMPALSPTMTAGTIAGFKVKLGDKISPGDLLCDIETDKATIGWESQDEGYIAKILVSEGATEVAVGVPIFVVVDDSGIVPSFEDFTVDTTKPQSSGASAAKAGGSDQPKSGAGSSVQAAPSVGVAGVDYTEIPHSNIRRVIASRLLESKTTIPHYYLSMDVCVDDLLKLRDQLNSKAKYDKEGKPDYKLSVNDFIIKASALALRDHPEVNVSWMENAIRKYNYIDISVAVASPTGSQATTSSINFDGFPGLITPIVTDADMKGLLSISNEVDFYLLHASQLKSSQVKALAAKARDGKLQVRAARCLWGLDFPLTVLAAS
eukprot:762994-Hanusia_phi.AAC.3